MISPLNPTVTSPATFLVRPPEPVGPAVSDDSSLSVQAPVSLLSADDHSPALAAPTFSATALKLKFDTQTRASEHGEGALETRSKLRFQYVFQSADGTGIKIDAKIKLNEKYAQSEDDNGFSQKLKFKARLHIEVLQRDVAESGQQLAVAPQIPDQAKAVIGDAIDLFGQISNALLNAFQQGDSVDGDALIAGIVESFNDLTQSVLGANDPAALPPEGLPPEGLPPEALPPAEGLPIEGLPPIEPTVADPETPVTVTPVALERPPVAGEPIVPSESGPTAGVPPEGDPVDPAAPEPSAHGEADQEANEIAEVSDDDDRPQDVAAITRQTLLKLRLRFVQTLDQLATTLGQDDSSTALVDSPVRAESRFRFDLSYLQVTAAHSSAGAAVDETA